MPVFPGRHVAHIDGDFVVFLIGMRINKPWKVHKWLPVFLGMPRMLKELNNRPESGFLGHTFGLPVMVQYWRSFDDLEAYARSHDGKHWPAWVAFNKRMRAYREDVPTTEPLPFGVHARVLAPGRVRLCDPVGLA